MCAHQLGHVMHENHDQCQTHESNDCQSTTDIVWISVLVPMACDRHLWTGEIDVCWLDSRMSTVDLRLVVTAL